MRACVRACVRARALTSCGGDDDDAAADDDAADDAAAADDDGGSWYDFLLISMLDSRTIAIGTGGWF